MNSCMGPILLLVFGIISLVTPNGFQTIAPGLSSYGFVINLVPMCILIMSPTSSTFSIEGNTFWLLKNLPIKFRTIALSKILAYSIVFLIPSLLGCLLLTFALELTLLEAVGMLCLVITAIILVSLLGMAINLNFYNLHWTNEVVVVKQSASAFISIILGLVIGLVPGIIVATLLTPYMSLFNWGWVICGLYLLASFGLWIYIHKKGEKQFNKMS